MNLFDLMVKITLDSDDYEKGLDDAGQKTESFASKLGSGLKNAAAVGAKALAAVSAAAATGVVAMTKAAIENYGEYEQLVGGVETLYGQKYKSAEEYAEKTGSSLAFAESVFEDYSEREKSVLENAANAYKTAGMSANEYMETVTGFAASLTSSLGQYEWQAGNYADMIVSDMADNANKMGSSLESIQNAYSGFAKQNYTMLDNLKLGYGGTKEEMERLLRDAEKLVGFTEGSLDISNFADIADAIHIIQEEMGITGTTALEAASTIQGSASSMKAAWQNLITGIADDTQDFDGLINNFVESVSAFGGNILPRISVAMGGIVNLVSGLAPQIIAAIPPLIEEILPQLISGIDSIVSSVIEVLPGLVTTIATVISEQADLLIQSGLDLLLMLGQSLLDNAPTLVDVVVNVINSLALWLVEYADVLLETGIQIITILATALTENLPVLIPVMVEAILLLVETLTSPDQISNLIDAAIAIIMALAEGLINALPALLEQAPVIIVNLVAALIENIPKLVSAAAELVIGLVTGIIESLPKIGEAAGKIITTLVTGVTNLQNKIREVGKNIVAGVWNGINEKITWFTNKVKGFFTGIVDGVKSALGIHSPSKVFAGIGEYMAAGLGQGWDSEFSSIKKDIANSMDFGVGTVGFEASAINASTSGLSEKLAQSLSVIGEGATIVVQSILDGKVIGENAYQYSRNKLKAYGG